jgi:hypothetical protein
MAHNHDDPTHDAGHIPDIAFDLDADKINEQGMVRLKRDGTPASLHYKADNSGGHGNPPVKSQFTTGNKRGGRKKKDRSMEAALQREFSTKVSVKRDGKIKKIDITEVLARRKRDRALTGSDRMLDAAIELAKQYGPKEAPRKFDVSWMNEDELSLIIPFLTAMIMKNGDEESVDDLRAELRKSKGLYKLAEGPDGLPRFTRVEEPGP